jgi:hypothetical protein
VELNEGQEVDEADVTKVLKEAAIVTVDKLSKPGMIKAISLW